METLLSAGSSGNLQPLRLTPEREPLDLDDRGSDSTDSTEKGRSMAKASTFPPTFAALTAALIGNGYGVHVYTKRETAERVVKVEGYGSEGYGYITVDRADKMHPGGVSTRRNPSQRALYKALEQAYHNATAGDMHDEHPQLIY
jgi:hypothetical protein